MGLVLLLLFFGASAAFTEELIENDDSQKDLIAFPFDLEDLEGDIQEIISIRAGCSSNKKCHKKKGTCIPSTMNCDRRVKKGCGQDCSCCVKDCYTDRKCRKKKGTCISSSEYCKGRVEKGCGASCSCCVIEQESCEAQSTCTQAKGYCIKNSEKCHGWTFDGCKGNNCTCCITANSNLTWHSVGSTDKFVRFVEEMSWPHGRDMCKNHSLDLFVPEDPLAVSKYLNVQFKPSSGFGDYWIGGRGNGEHQIWITGEKVPEDGPWSSNLLPPNVATHRCLAILTADKFIEAANVLGIGDCNSVHLPVLCA